MKKKIELKPHHGVALFAFQILVFVFVCAPLQYNLGMAGLAATQVILLLLAVIPAVLSGNSLREIFPVKRATMRNIFGVLLFWLGGVVLNMIIMLVTAYLFPDELLQSNRGVSDFFMSVHVIAGFAIVAVMPGICEEALHRGFIQYSMRGLNKWTLVFVMGLIFGIFHLDPLRFLPTAMLGAILSYMMLETKNIIIPAAFHMFNNAVSFTVTALSSELSGEAEATAVSGAEFSAALGAYLILGAIVPWLFLWGGKLLHTKEYNLERKAEQKKAAVVAAVISPLMLIAGGVAVVWGGLALVEQGGLRFLG
ncbi:MAG: CPBP family intramembrane metalloprotease [Oscillospiraceae bacterium]|nr:CPBP family intramembrane metalloprotease [Oscillospiraceae bacterium]